MTDEKIYGGLLDPLGNGGLCDARSGFALLGHQAAVRPEGSGRRSTKRAALEMAWARLEWWPYGHAPAVGSLAMKTSRITIDAGTAARLEALARMVHRPTAEIVRTLSYATFDHFLRLHARRSVTQQRGRPEAFGQ